MIHIYIYILLLLFLSICNKKKYRIQKKTLASFHLVSFIIAIVVVVVVVVVTLFSIGKKKKGFSEVGEEVKQILFIKKKKRRLNKVFAFHFLYGLSVCVFRIRHESANIYNVRKIEVDN